MKKLNFIDLLIAFVIIAGIYTVVRHFYFQPTMNANEKAPDFIGVRPDNTAFKLSDQKGKLVLLDFWGSWCGPCIRESPALVALHEKYKETVFHDASGFLLVSIGIEMERQRWLNAIDRLGHNWPDQIIDPVSSLRFFDSPIAKLYSVKQVPTKFLIDESGKIALINPEMEAIHKYLDSRIQRSNPSL
jgi:thiol-disulfide isomerase/thioredoxin